MTLAVWLHNLSPVLIELGPVPIRWYGLSYLAGFFVAYLMLKRICRVGVSTLKPQHAADLVVAVAIGIVLGGRLGYVLLYQPSLIGDFSKSIPFWGVLAINKGGMASHGGMVGGLLGCLYYARRHGHDFFYLADLFAFTAPLGVFFGRIANFINGELLGRPCDPSFPLAVKFPQELLDATPEKLGAVFAALPPPGSIIPGLVSWDRWTVIELIQSGNAVVSRAVEPFLTPRHPSQLYAAVSEGLVVLAVLTVVWARPRRPGLVAGLCAMVYAVMRITDEFFRMPDAHLMDKEFATFHITRGQWLSGLLFIVGVVLCVVSLKRKATSMGGWMNQQKDTDGNG
jgi:phosphatidylglycerol---prolipoprotein diacylglyceryl transferase